METDRIFSGAIPALYDRHLGPFLFAPYAADLADRVARLAPMRVLETAAGTGIVTRALLGALRPGATLLATDLNQPMLDHAAAQAPAGRVEWRQADATALPFAASSFDLVVCQFGVMFFPDKLAGYREARRVLRRGGCFIFSVWDRIEANEVAQIVIDSVGTLFADDPPQFLRRGPHGYHDVAAIKATLGQAGFATVSVDAVERRGRAPSHRDPAIGFCLGTPLRAEIEARDPGRLDRAVEHAAAAVAARFGEGPLEASLRAYVVTATA